MITAAGVTARVFTGASVQIDHAEGVAVHEDGSVWCGGEAGQVYRIELDGSHETVAMIEGGVLLGLALGAALVRMVTSAARGWLAACQTLVGVALALQVLLLARFGDLLGWIAVRATLSGFVDLEIGLALAVAALILLPTMAFGASFPLTVAAYPSAASGARRTGTVAGSLSNTRHRPRRRRVPGGGCCRGRTGRRSR